MNSIGFCSSVLLLCSLITQPAMHLHLCNPCYAPCLCVTGSHPHLIADYCNAHLFIITVAVLNHYTTDICANDNVISELRCKSFYNTVQHPLLKLLLKAPQWQARLSYSRLPCFLLVKERGMAHHDLLTPLKLARSAYILGMCTHSHR